MEIKITEKQEGTFTMVDLQIGDITINTGSNPFDSMSILEDLEVAVQRAIFKLKMKNPDLSFDISLETMGMTDEDKKKNFIKHMQHMHPGLDVKKIIDMFDEEISKIQLTGPDDNHPNPEMKMPIGNDLNKNICICVIDKLYGK